MLFSVHPFMYSLYNTYVYQEPMNQLSAFSFGKVLKINLSSKVIYQCVV